MAYACAPETACEGAQRGTLLPRRSALSRLAAAAWRRCCRWLRCLASLLRCCCRASCAVCRWDMFMVLLRQEVLLLEFVQRVPYCCVGIENRVDIAVPWLCVRQGWLRRWIQLLTLPGCACCASYLFALILSRIIVASKYETGPRHACPCNFTWRLWGVIWSGTCFCANVGIACREWLDVSKLHVHVAGEYHFSVEYCLIWVWLRRGVVLLRGFLLCLLSYHYPLFPPKKKSDAEKAELARAELDAFNVIASHGKVPSQHSDLPGSKIFVSETPEIETPASVETWLAPWCLLRWYFEILWFSHGRIPRRQKYDNGWAASRRCAGTTLGPSSGAESVTSQWIVEWVSSTVCCGRDGSRRWSSGCMRCCLRVFWHNPAVAEAPSGGTVTRKFCEQRMRLLGGGIALWLRRHQWAKSCCQATVLSLVRPRWAK